MSWLRSLPLLLLLPTPILAADWPGWLGPRRDGASTEKVAPWKGDLEILWRVPVGPGHSSPIVAGGKVFLHTQVRGKASEELTAFDAATGKSLWNTSYTRGFFFSPFGTGPQATPTISQGKIYTYGITGVLSCFDVEKGTHLWQVDTWKEFDITLANKRRLFFGAACSPLLDGDRVVVNVGGKGASVVAFSRDKGTPVWKSLDDGPSYSSGIAIGSGADRQLVFLTQEGVRGFEPDTGKKLWDFPLKDKANESSTTPVLAGNLLLATSVTFGMVGLKIDRKDGKYSATQVWKNPKLTCYFSTPIPVGKKHVYLVSGQMSFTPTSTLHCVETDTGKILWSKPKIGKYHAALLRTGDDRLLLLSDLGDLILLEPDAKVYKELARSRVVKGEQIWAHPALVDGKLYLRDEKHLICVKMPAP